MNLPPKQRFSQKPTSPFPSCTFVHLFPKPTVILSFFQGTLRAGERLVYGHRALRWGRLLGAEPWHRRPLGGQAADPRCGPGLGLLPWPWRGTSCLVETTKPGGGEDKKHIIWGREQSGKKWKVGKNVGLKICDMILCCEFWMIVECIVAIVGSKTHMIGTFGCSLAWWCNHK